MKEKKYVKSYKLSKSRNSLNDNNHNFHSLKSPNKSKSHHDIYHTHKEHFDRIEEIIGHLSQIEGLAKEEVFEILNKKNELTAVPLSVFSSWLAPLEALVLYMKEHLKMEFSQIAWALQRDHRTIWLTYRNAKKKNMGVIVSHENFVPIGIFSNRNLSVLENLSVYLYEQRGHSFKEIGDLTKKDNRTIWTVYHRAKKKATNLKAGSLGGKK